MKIFGREPAAVVGLLEALIVLLVAVGLDWSQEQVGLTLACVNAVLGAYVAWATHDTLLGAVVGAVKATLALIVGFGLASLTAEQTAAILGFTSVALSLFNRTQTFPEGDPPQALAGATPVSDVGTL